MNRTLKETLTKLTMETGGDWVSLLPFTLYGVRNSPYKLGLSRFEIMYGVPPPIIPTLWLELLVEIDDHNLLLSLNALQSINQNVRRHLRAL